MAVIRVEKTRDYTVMCNYHLRDKRLSLKAKGLMSEMLSLPDEWDYSVAGLAAINKEEQGAINSALKELKEAGYLEVVKNKPSKENGGRIDYDYVLHEKSFKINQLQGGSFQGVEIQGIEVQGVENAKQLNTNKINTKEENIKGKNKKERINEMTYDEVLDNIDCIRDNSDLRNTCVEYIKMRKRIKAPLTSFALYLNMNEAYRLANGDLGVMKEIIEQSIMNSWRGVFPLKDKTQAYNKNVQNTGNEFDALLKEEGYA